MYQYKTKHNQLMLTLFRGHEGFGCDVISFLVVFQIPMCIRFCYFINFLLSGDKLFPRDGKDVEYKISRNVSFQYVVHIALIFKFPFYLLCNKIPFL